LRNFSEFLQEIPFFWSSSTLLEKALTATFLGKRLIKKIHIKFLVKLFQSLMRQGFLSKKSLGPMGLRRIFFFRSAKIVDFWLPKL